ncbi:MAG: hypothetical protein J6U04_12865 [Salinivirgaceae bacterium]|nr:hypothetical protein [Salinivirgaceae bacterium]
MIRKTIVILLFIVLAGFESYLLYERYCLNKEIQFKDIILKKITIEHSVMKMQYAIGLENNGLNLDGNTEIWDALGNETTLGAYIKNVNKKNILVCRYSEMYCRQCVEHAIGNILKSWDNIDSLNVIFVGDNTSQRVANMQRKEFGISKFNCINSNSLGIPAEKLQFPYYLAIDKELKINGIYMPDKSTAHMSLDSVNLALMYKQLICDVCTQ